MNTTKDLFKSFREVSHNATFAGVALMVAFLLALAWSNISINSYTAFWNQPFSIGFNGHVLEKPLLIWINDGLMAFFFFVVGLEIKREVLFGELNSIQKSITPAVAALGGMLVPALIYILLNKDGANINGWGIPMATDIAFSLGVISLLGNHIPKSAKIFIVALAIVDDLGAVLVIALFYSSDISIINLCLGLSFFVTMLISNFIGIRNTVYYGLLGIGGVWFTFLLSGVHPTIAGIIAAFTIPANRTISVSSFNHHLLGFYSKIRRKSSKAFNQKLINTIRDSFEGVEPPLQKLEYRFAPWVNYLVLPLFALANAGFVISDSFHQSIFSSVGLGTFSGLLFGKPLGILLSLWIFKKLNLIEFPAGLTNRHLIGVSILAGIGFTMSLFISNLAFSDPQTLTQAKAGVFLASMLAGILGYLVLRKKMV